MAVAKDALTTSSLTSYTHTPVGTPRGVLVTIVMANAADVVTGVTYGGTAMAETANSPLVASGAEGGTCYAYFLGASVPTGAQTVAISVSAGTPRSLCQTVTAAADCEVITTGVINETGVTGDRTGTLSTGGRTSVAMESVWSSAGAVTGVNPLASWTAQVENDEGAETNYRYTYDTVGTSDVTFGATMTGTDDIAVLAVAIGEVTGSTYTLDADSATYSYTATAAGVEHGYLIDAAAASYAYTATDVAMTRDIPLSADAAAYTYTASDAALEYTSLSTYTLDAASAAYAWTATDAGLLAGYLVDADTVAYSWVANDAGLEYSTGAVATPTPVPGAGKGSRRKRRRILLDDGVIWEPRTEEEFQEYIDQLLRAAQARQEAEEAEPDPKPRARKNTRARLKTAMPERLPEALPGEFYTALANNRQRVLNSQAIARAWVNYLAEAEEDEALTMLLLA